MNYTADCEYCGEKFDNCPYKGSVKLHIDHAKEMGDWPDWTDVVAVPCNMDTEKVG